MIFRKQLLLPLPLHTYTHTHTYTYTHIHTHTHTHTHTHHLVFVLSEDAEFLEEGDHENEQLLVLSLHQSGQLRHQSTVTHLQLHTCVLSKVQEEEIEGD